MQNQDDKAWIAELDNMGVIASSIEELQAFYDAIPDADKGHPRATWLEGLILGRSFQE